jgi:hypothetical protein
VLDGSYLAICDLRHSRVLIDLSRFGLKCTSWFQSVICTFRLHDFFVRVTLERCLACEAEAVGTVERCLACEAQAVGTVERCLAREAEAVGTVERCLAREAEAVGTVKRWKKATRRRCGRPY